MGECGGADDFFCCGIRLSWGAKMRWGGVISAPNPVSAAEPDMYINLFT